MAHRTQYLSFQVYLTDPVAVQALQVQYPRGRIMAPDAAATEYAAPIQLDDVTFAPPCTRSPWFQSTFNYPRNVHRFNKPTSGWWSLIITGNGRFVWVAQFVYGNANPNTFGSTPLTDRMPTSQRLWAHGFELPSDSTSSLTGEGSTPSGATSSWTRGASRIPGGMGCAIRGNNGRTTMLSTRLGGSNTRSAWERIYVTRRTNAQGYFWCALTASARGIFFQLLDGVLVVHDGTSGTPAIVGTIADFLPNLDETKRLDILYTWGVFTAAFPLTGADVGQIDILVNGEHKLSLTLTANNNGFTVEGAANAVHVQSDTAFGGTNDDNFAVDVDDWICAAFPGTNGRTWLSGVATVINNHYYYQGGWYKALTVQTGTAPVPTADTANWLRLAPGIDFQNGSHVTLVGAKALSASDAGWAGDYRLLMQRPPSGGGFLLGRTSSTSGAVCQIATDFRERVLRRPGYIGVAAFTVATWAQRAGALDGTVGYKLGAAAPVNATIVQIASATYGRLMYRPAGAASLTDITDLELIHTKAADVSAAVCYNLLAAVEVIGQFADCDIPFGSTVTESRPNRGGPHNSAYPLSQWVQALAPPISPVRVQAGTYVGNGTGQDLLFSQPVHFIYVRGTGGADSGGLLWFPSMMGPHQSTNDGNTNVFQPDSRENMDFAGAAAEGQAEQQYFVRIAGNSAQINGIGVTYEYVAICDPGMRFLCAAAGAFDSAVTTGHDVRLANTDFLPEAVLMFPELIGGNTSAQAKTFRGPGHTGNQASPSAAVVFTNGLLPALGKVTCFPSANISDGHTIALLAMRSNDGSGDAGARRVVEFQTWTGNGSGSRDVLIPGSTGRRPLLVLVWPNDNGGMHFRDPSHTAANSSRYDGAIIGNALTAGGIDQFTVGAALNVNTVVYNALIVIGDTVAGNAGWSANATLDPVEPDSLGDSPWGDDELSDEEIEDQGFDPETFDELEDEAVPVVGEPDLEPTVDILDDATNIGGNVGGNPCEFYTREIVNLALSHLEISKVVGNLATENSEVASLARRCIRQDVNTTLRDFPWDFATRYAELVLVAGSETAPVNNDWIYSYRAPTSMIFARRIAKVEKGRTFDQAPITFRLGQDASGQLVFCNSLATALVPLVLEYTHRNECPAFWGDPLFREALSWRVAASLSPLARDAKKKGFCLSVYQAVLERARTVDANEQQQEPNGDADWITGRN